MSVPKITVVDFGAGNLFSIRSAIECVGGKVEVTGDPEKIAAADRLILPGVGAFESAMNKLDETGISQAVKDYVETGRQLLGICLGMQLLFDESYEFGRHKGLGLIAGKVVRFREPAQDGESFKIPQICWNKVELPHDKENADNLWKGTILGETAFGSFFYFVHSYRCIPERRADVLAETYYGRDRFCSVTRRNNISGCQFHPERSGEAGLKISVSYTHLTLPTN